MTTGESDPKPFQRDYERVSDRVVTSAALLWATNMLLRVLQLATTAILARILSPADYGIVALATTVVGFLDLMSNLQVGGAIIKSRDLTLEHLDTAFTLNLIRGCLTAVLLAVFARPVASYMHDPRLTSVLIALAVAAVIGCIHNPYFLLLERNLDFWRESKRSASAALAGSLVGIAAALMLHSYWALVASSIATSATMMILSYWGVPGRPKLGLAKASELLSYGSWLVFINIMEYINSKIDYVLIGRSLGSRVLGAYHVGQQITLTATGDVVAPLSRALFPAFSIMSADLDRLRTGYRQIQSLTLAIALPIGFGVSVLADNIILLLAGRTWELAVPVVIYLAPIIALHTMIASVESLALSMGQGRLLVFRTGIFLCVRTGLMVAGFYYGGFLGIVYARMVSGTFFLVYGLALAAKITRGRLIDPIVSSWRSFASVVVMWCGLRLVSSGDIVSLSIVALAGLLIAKIALGGLLYAGTHALLWRAAGLPHGAEQHIMDQGRRMLRKLTGRF
jgi:O-antigen/teichoic acid export membrane protein